MEAAPLPAVVRPRARRAEAPDAEPVLLADLVRPLVDSGARGVVLIRGPAGAGKTTALRQLALELGRDGVAFLDDPSPRQLAARPEALKIYAARRSLLIPHLLIAELEPWSRDDVLELLLARAPERCVALFPALTADPFAGALSGAPELWSAVVSASLEDCRPGVARALRAQLQRMLGPRPRRRLAGAAALAHLAHDPRAFERIRLWIARRHGSAPGDRLVLLTAPRLLLAADHLALRLRAGRLPRALFHELPSDVVALAGARARSSRRAQTVLEELVGEQKTCAVAASLLHAGDPGWLGGFLGQRPGKLVLNGAHLQGARLAEVEAVELDARHARFQGSDWSGASIRRFYAAHAKFARAALANAHFWLFRAPHALFAGADLRGFRSEQAVWGEADLTGARARGARLPGAALDGAILRRADFSEAVLDEASLEGAEADGLALARASLKRAKLRGLDLRTADLRGAQLAGADLSRANLEGLELPQAQLQGAFLVDAYLTATRMPGAQLREARLIGAGLAEIDWEGADLSGADLTRASFHLGSSRSGLVGGYPSQGTRTGFYTDARLDLQSQPPEEVRKANLCRADLRGANVRGTDFYLVDLRGALYTADQERHFRATGAILGAL